MSLEAKFAELKIDDAPSIVEEVKTNGAKKSGLAANIATLVARCDSKDEAECLAALKTVESLAKECPGVMQFTKECMGACKLENGSVRATGPNRVSCTAL